MSKSHLPIEDSELIQQIKAGDPEASLAIKYLLQSKKWFRFAIKQSKYQRGNHEDAKDIFQESITKLVSNIAQGKFKGKSSLYKYYEGICKNIAKEKFRKNNRLKGLKEKINLFSFRTKPYNFDVIVFNEKDQEQLQELLEKTIELVDKPCIEILKMKLRGWSNEVIAEKLDKSKSAISSKVSRCYKKMQVFLKENPTIYNKIKKF